ncbi:hypothetical protein ABNF97_10550 [Plantactinospora sp. B6F1]|uniref:hypothetical protein n=1 Tax=Plantactinospora sp. B6F1 TaxID=3158971 RepID=UPI0032D93CA3
MTPTIEPGDSGKLAGPGFRGTLGKLARIGRRRGAPPAATPAAAPASGPGPDEVGVPSLAGEVTVGSSAEPVESRPAEPAKARPAEPAKARPAEPAKTTPAEPAKTTPAEPAKARPAEPATTTPGAAVEGASSNRAGADRGGVVKQSTAGRTAAVTVPDQSPDSDVPRAGRRLLLPLAAATVVLVGVGVSLAVNDGGRSGKAPPAAAPTEPELALGSPLPAAPTSAPAVQPSPTPQASPTPKASKAPPRPARPASAPKPARTPSRKPPAKTTAPAPKPPAPQARISASGRVECTRVDRGWGVAITGSVTNTSATIRSARVSYSSNETGPASNSDTLTLNFSGRSFDRRIPNTNGWEFIGGSSVSWTVTVTLSDGKTVSTSGSNRYSCG